MSRGAWPEAGPRKFPHSGCPLTACLVLFFLILLVRSATFKSTSPTPCSAAYMGRSAPFPWRRGSTSHSPTSPRTARASSSACLGTDPRPGAPPLRLVGPDLIADPCYCPLEISSQGSCAGRSPRCLPSGPSPEVFFLAFCLWSPSSPVPIVHGPQSTNQRPRRPAPKPGLTSRPQLTSEATRWCPEWVKASLDWPGLVSVP